MTSKRNSHPAYDVCVRDILRPRFHFRESIDGGSFK